MFNLNSNQVVVFPVAKERHFDAPESRLLTEKNVSNIIRQILGNKSGFVISCERDSIKNTYTIEFNLSGYYFKLIDVDLSEYDTSADIYASITIDINSNEIYETDKNDNHIWKYLGLSFYISTDDSDMRELSSSTHSLKILSFNSMTNQWEGAVGNVGFITSLIGGIDGKH